MSTSLEDSPAGNRVLWCPNCNGFFVASTVSCCASGEAHSLVAIFVEPDPEAELIDEMQDFGEGD